MDILGGAEAIQEMRSMEKHARRRKSSKPGTTYGGAILPEMTIVTVPTRRTLDTGQVIPADNPETPVLMPDGRTVPAGRLMILPDDRIIPVMAGGSRQYFMDTLNEPPIANLTAVTATAETLLWAPASYSPIGANDARPGKIYKVTAGGVWTNATTGSLSLTGRFGLLASSPTMGTMINTHTVPTSAVTANPFYLTFVCVIRTVGAAGANSKMIGSGMFATGGTAAVATTSMWTALGFGGTSATADVSIATGIAIDWTLTVAGTVTPHWAFIQSLN